MESPSPQNEHKWLQRLVGNWTFEGECSMGPDQPPMKNNGTELVKPLGELWTVGHMSGEVPGSGMSRSIMTLGYDPQKKRFVGTFVASMMTYLWIYNGALDASGTTLILDCEGPSFAEEGKLAKYQDIIEIIDENHRTLRSQFMGPEGQWVPFMKSTYRRCDD
jgi:hypothetical protein